MSYISDCQFDLFISYAHTDNEAGPDAVQWVSQLQNYLSSALRQRMGLGADQLSIFFDPILRANQQLPELLEAARNSAVFLAVGSRSWVSRDFTQRELEAFSTANPDPSRLFLIEFLPLHTWQTYPEALRHHLRIEMHMASMGAPAMPLSPANESWRFKEKVHKLAEQIGERLLEMRNKASNRGATPLAHPPAGVPNAGASMRTVLIAQPTDDLEEETAQLEHYLHQFGVATRCAGRNPQGGKEFAEAFFHDAAESALFVQLLGPLAGRAPPDLPTGYAHFQAEAAAAAGLKIMQWRRPDVDPTAVRDPRHATLLQSEHVMCSTLEEFKARVKDEARFVPLQHSTKRKPNSLVFIDADSKDIDVAKAIQKEFTDRKFSVILPRLTEGPEESRHDLEENLVDSDVILFLYGSAKSTWIRGQLRLFTKLQHRREAEPRALAICIGPPSEKEDIGFVMPEIRELVCPEDWNMEPIRSLIEEIDR